MSNFAMVVQYQFEGERQKAIILDTINDNMVDSSAEVTTQPIVNGDTIADHMFRRPKTVSVSGVCSLNGSKGIVVDGTGSKLANFEELFERIQNEGVKCTLYKISIQNEKDIRFKQRTNMVLQSISFTERINNIGFNLRFIEAISTEIIEYDVDVDDKYLPNVTEPATLSFTDTLIDWNKIDASVCEILEKEQLWTTEFKTFLTSMTQPTLQSLILGASAAIIASVLVALNTTPVGWVLTAIGLTVGAVIIFVKGLIEAIAEAKRRRKYAIEQFKFFNNEQKDAQELERFADFISSIHNEFIAINDKIHVYQISENVSQEAMISVGDDYFIFTFTKNNVDQVMSLHIENIDKSITKELPNITATITSFAEASSTNYLVKAKNNSRVYLISPTENKDDLTNYYIVVCDFNPDDFNNIINDIISSHIYRNA